MEIQGGKSREELGGRIRTQKPKKTCGFYMFFAKHVVFLQVFQCFFRKMLFFHWFFNVFGRRVIRTAAAATAAATAAAAAQLITSELSSPEGFVRE